MKISQTGTGSTLYLRNSPNSDNSGKYSCRASNPLGETTEHFTVTHNGRSCYCAAVSAPVSAVYSAVASSVISAANAVVSSVVSRSEAEFVDDLSVPYTGRRWNRYNYNYSPNEI